MKQLRVEFYFSDYEWDDTIIKPISFDASEEEYEALLSIGNATVTSDEIDDAISEGSDALVKLHDRLSEEFYNLLNHELVFNTYNELEDDSLEESFKTDLEKGLLPPELIERFKENLEYQDESLNRLLHSANCTEVNDNIAFSNLFYLVREEYRNWVYQHEDIYFIAERTGLDLDASKEIYDDEYTIYLTEPAD